MASSPGGVRYPRYGASTALGSAAPVPDFRWGGRGGRGSSAQQCRTACGGGGSGVSSNQRHQELHDIYSDSTDIQGGEPACLLHPRKLPGPPKCKQLHAQYCGLKAISPNTLGGPTGNGWSCHPAHARVWHSAALQSASAGLVMLELLA